MSPIKIGSPQQLDFGKKSDFGIFPNRGSAANGIRKKIGFRIFSNWESIEIAIGYEPKEGGKNWNLDFFPYGSPP